MPATIDLLAAYIPSLVLGRLADEPSGLAGRGIERRQAAVLFADISGFTILTERLAARGASGSEELSAALNAYFDRLIEMIADRGGDVVKMAGDALIALWPVGEGETLASATLRAARCGLVAARTLQDYEVAEGIRLACKVGIGAGEVASMFVGGVRDRWELLVAGDPLVQMGRAEHHARPGEAVLSREAWALAWQGCAGDLLEDGGVRLKGVAEPPPSTIVEPPLDPTFEAATRSFIPAAIRSRLDAGQTAWLAELRRLTVLFVNLPLTDCDRPGAAERARRIIEVVQAGLYRHEGSLNKLSVDEKGTTIVAAMGLPPLSHRDDPARAIRAGLAIRKALAEIGVECAIGIATGRVYCGEIGNARRREYTIIGRAVNLAARIMQAAQEHHEVLCDEETSRAARGCYEFEALPSRRLKNIEGEVTLCRPLDAVAPCGASRATVGRDAELATLARKLEGLRRGQGGVVVIEGEAGIGKSQLVSELVARAAGSGISPLVGGGDPIERSAPYHAWRPIFQTLLGADEATDRETRLARVANWLREEPDLEPLAPLLDAVLPLDLAENELTGHMTGQVRLDNTNDLLVRLLGRASARGPKLVVVEDAHWMDSASWALMLRVARGVGGILLVVATRPVGPDFPEEHQALLQVADDILRLGNLATDDALALARLRLGVASLPPAAEELILRKSRGNPLHCEELSYTLRDAGLLTFEGDRCRVADGVDLASVGIPDGVEGIINDRIDRLAPSHQLALKVASVIGRLFAVRILRDVYPIEPDRARLPQDLDSLSRLELILRDEPEPDPAYIFRHVITRDVVYDLLPFSQRRRLHHDVAEWYERTLSGDLAPYYPLLAHHWSLAGDDDRAVDYLEKAGEEALKGGAYKEAVDFLDRALEIHARARPGLDPGREARWEYQLGEAHLSLGHLARSREHAARALSLLARPIPTPIRLPGAYLAQLATQAVRRLRARPLDGPSESRHAGRLASATFGLVGQLCYFDQDRAIGVYSALRSLNLAEEDGPSPELARALAVMCLACGLVPAHSLAEVYRRRAFEVANDLDDVATRAWVLQLTGMYDLGIGAWERARPNLEEAVAVNRRLGDWRRWEESSGELARLDYYLGEYDRSAGRFREFGEEAGRRGHDQACAWSFHGRSKALLRQGRLDEAADLLERSLALPVEALGGGDAILRGGLLAWLHARRRDWEAAERAADETSKLIRLSPPMVSYSFEGYAGVADAYLALWEAGEGRHVRRSAWLSLASLWRMARVYPLGRPRAWLALAKARRLLGHRRRAARAYRLALRDAERLAMPFERALAHLETGEFLGRDDPAGRDHLDRARSIFEGLGAGPLAP